MRQALDTWNNATVGGSPEDETSEDLYKIFEAYYLAQLQESKSEINSAKISAVFKIQLFCS